MTFPLSNLSLRPPGLRTNCLKTPLKRIMPDKWDFFLAEPVFKYHPCVTVYLFQRWSSKAGSYLNDTLFTSTKTIYSTADM